MWTSPLELKCLLMWLLFGFIKGNKQEKCPDPPSAEFADVTAEAYAPETRLYYECDSGYDRRAGESLGIQCKSDQRGASWVPQTIECLEKKALLSVTPTKKLHSTQNPENEAQGPALQKEENFLEFDQKGFCGPPKTFPHASLSPDRFYYVGQVLHFKCQSGYDKRPPTFGNSTCKKVNDKIIWTPLDMRCTNDSNQWLPLAIESGSTYPSSFSSVTLSVTASCFVLLIISAVFV